MHHFIRKRWTGRASGEREIARGNHTLRVFLRRTLVRENIAGELLLNKLIVRLILVESVDNVVTIKPRLGYGIVSIIAGRVGVVHNVHPVPSPAFTVASGGE